MSNIVLSRHLLERIPILAFVGASGSGKTTLLTKILTLLTEQGLRIGAIKHTHHDFDIDVPGKDSYELRKAGATQTLVGSRQRWVFIVERPSAKSSLLGELVQQLQVSKLDLILAGGFKDEPVYKIEVHRPRLDKSRLCGSYPYVIAVASDQVLSDSNPLPILNLNDPNAIVHFILNRLAIQSGLSRPDNAQDVAHVLLRPQAKPRCAGALDNTRQTDPLLPLTAYS